MTIVSTSGLLTEISGGTAPQVDYMFGIGLSKESDAVYFQYQGDEQTVAFTHDNGKPVTRFSNVRVTGLSIGEDIGVFKQTKLNLFVETQQGTSIMLTSGLTTLWSKCIITGLMGLFADDSLDSLINIDSWKGTSKLRPCFAAIRNNGVKVINEDIKERINEADKDQKEALIRECVALISEAVTGIPVASVAVDEPVSNSQLKAAAGDF